MTKPRRLSQDEFIKSRQAHWTTLDNILLSPKRLHALPPDQIARAGVLYRAVCADLMRAKGAGYSRDVVAYLDALAARAHNAIYRSAPYRLEAISELVLRDFPRTLRESWKFFAVATALFVVPFVIGVVGALTAPEFATEVLPEAQLEMMAEAYSEGFSSGRGEGEDSMMAGFYVYNNVGISFRVFATGIFFGLGSVYFLVYNGLMIGTVLGYVTSAGAGRNIITFVCGHGSFELTAIVISGAAGLRMGYAMVRTEGRTRLGSLRAQGPAVARLALGAAVMLGIAALIEGFWSPSGLPDIVKWSVASALWLLVIAYFIFAGRGGAR